MMPMNALEKQETKTGKKVTKRTKRTKTETIEMTACACAHCND